MSGHHLSHFLASCPPSLRVLPPFVSSLPSFLSSLCTFPPFVSFLPSCLSSLHVHWWGRACSSLLTRQFPLLCWGSPLCPSPLPSRLILSVMVMKSNNILPSLTRLTNDTYHISLHGMLVHDPPPLCPAHSSWTSAACPPSSFVFTSEDAGWPTLFLNNTRSTMDVECALFLCRV